MEKTGKLVLVGTPIGNLEDWSPRARRALEEADFIAAEDTRVTGKLCSHFGIKKPMVSYYEHNLRQRGEQLLARIASGQVCALVTDAGMPCLSDPGEDLVALCAGAGVPVEVVPGPSAAISALAVSGLPAGRFAFEGFLSVKASSRAQRLDELRGERRTLIFYEAPHKLLRTLRDLSGALGPRRVALVRELTKLHETVWRGTLPEAAAYAQENPPRGEYVLIVEGAPEPEAPGRAALPQAAALAASLAREGAPLSAAARQAAAETGLPRGDIYRAAQALLDSEGE